MIGSSRTPRLGTKLQFRDGAGLGAPATGRSDVQARERRPPVGTAARSAAKGVYRATVWMALNARVPAER